MEIQDIRSQVKILVEMNICIQDILHLDTVQYQIAFSHMIQQNQLCRFIPSILNAKGNYRATDVQFFKTTDDANGALNSETVNTVKQAVYNNGSVTCGITWDSGMIQEDKVSYYNNDDNDTNDSNHEVLIVGWMMITVRIILKV